MAALRLAGAGREVTILEKRALGGQCVHDGCMLVCALNDVARSIMSARHLEEMGILAGNVTVDYPALLEKLEATQDKLRYILNMETTGAGVKSSTVLRLRSETVLSMWTASPARRKR